MVKGVALKRERFTLGLHTGEQVFDLFLIKGQDPPLPEAGLARGLRNLYPGLRVYVWTSCAGAPAT